MVDMDQDQELWTKNSKSHNHSVVGRKHCGRSGQHTDLGPHLLFVIGWGPDPQSPHRTDSSAIEESNRDQEAEDGKLKIYTAESLCCVMCSVRGPLGRPIQLSLHASGIV